MKTTSVVVIFLSASFLSSCTKPREETASVQQEAKGTNLVEMKREAQEHVGLKVAPAAVSELKEYLQVTGTVQPIDSKVAQVRPLARGRVQEVFVRVGERVSAGTPLARLENIDAGELFAQLDSVQAELQRLRVQQATQMKQLERNRQLIGIGAIPQKDLEASQGEADAIQESIRSQQGVIEGVRAKLRRMGVDPAASRGMVVSSIRAPFAGVVTKVQTAPGELVDEGKDLFSVVDLSEVWVQAEVYEKDLGRIRLGQPAFITVDTYAGERFSGRVAYISDLLDSQTRTARVRCEVSNPGTRLKVDMFATVQLPTTFSRKALAVPISAVQQVEGKTVVFVQKDQTKFETRPVEVGKTVDDVVEITSGLQQGEKIVTQGGFHLKSILAGSELGEE
jgi:cobalt-zinc-cadmium efflux system membrane fusion protein